MNVNFISSTDNDDNRLTHSKKDNLEIIIGKETDEIVKISSFQSLLTRYQIGLEEYRLCL